MHAPGPWTAVHVGTTGLFTARGLISQLNAAVRLDVQNNRVERGRAESDWRVRRGPQASKCSWCVTWPAFVLPSPFPRRLFFRCLFRSRSAIELESESQEWLLDADRMVPVTCRTEGVFGMRRPRRSNIRHWPHTRARSVSTLFSRANPTLGASCGEDSAIFPDYLRCSNVSTSQPVLGRLPSRAHSNR